MKLTFSILLLAAGLARQTSAMDSSGYLLVANKGNHTLAIVDPIAGQVIATVEEDGVTGHEVVASPDGKLAYVPIYGNAGVGKPGTDGQLVRVIDIAAHKIVGTVDFGKGVRPHCAVFGPKDHLLYVGTEIENSISVIDPKTLKVLGALPTEQTESHMFAISSDNRFAYTANVGPGTMSVIDIAAKKVLAVIPIAPKTQRISLSVDDRWAFTSDQTKPELVVVDTATRKVANRIEMPGIGYGTAATPDGKHLLVVLIKLNKVGVIDLAAMKMAATIDVPKTPQEVIVRPDGGEAYVSCDASQQVVVIDTKNWKVAKLIKTGPGTDGLAWAKGN